MALIVQLLKRDPLTYHRSVGCDITLRFGVLNAHPEFLEVPTWFGTSVIGGRYYTANCDLVKVLQMETFAGGQTELQHWCVRADGYLYPYRTRVTTPWVDRSWCYPLMMNTIRRDLKARITQSSDSLFEAAHLMLLSGRHADDCLTQIAFDSVEDVLTDLQVDSGQCAADIYQEHDVYQYLHRYASEFASLRNGDDCYRTHDPLNEFVHRHYRPAAQRLSRRVMKAGVTGLPLAAAATAALASYIVDDIQPLRCEADQLPGWRTYRGDIMSILAHLPIRQADVWYGYTGTGQCRQLHCPDGGTIHWPDDLSAASKLAVQYQLASLAAIFYATWVHAQPEYPAVRLSLRLSPGDELLATIHSNDGQTVYGSYYVDAAYEYLSPLNLGSYPIC